jgi:hypothetical protein
MGKGVSLMYTLGRRRRALVPTYCCSRKVREAVTRRRVSSGASSAYKTAAVGATTLLPRPVPRPASRQSRFSLLLCALGLSWVHCHAHQRGIWWETEREGACVCVCSCVCV